MRGASLPFSTIQVGLSRHIIEAYVESWVVGIEDYTPRVRKIYNWLQTGRIDAAKKLLPPEKPYPIRGALARRLLIEP